MKAPRYNRDWTQFCVVDLVIDRQEQCTIMAVYLRTSKGGLPGHAIAGYLAVENGGLQAGEMCPLMPPLSEGDHAPGAQRMRCS